MLLVLLAAYVAPASSTTITIMPATGIANAVADRTAWLAANFDPEYLLDVTVTFDGLLYGPYNSLTTDIGAFSVMPGSLPGDPWQSSGTKTNQFTILNSSDTPFDGRYNTTPGGSNWLDSNDITKLQLSTSLSNIYFFITDVNDVDGRLQLATQDGTTAGFPTGAPNGNIYFVGITSGSAIGTLQWLNTSTNDGFGLDDFGKVYEPPPSVPEPAVWPVAATAFLAMWLVRRRKNQRSAPLD